MICAPIKKKNLKTLLESLKEAQNIVDLIEIWFDELDLDDKKNLELIFADKKKPFIYKSYSNLENIKKVLAHKVEFIDLDISTPLNIINEVKKTYPNISIILSFHDYIRTPSDKEFHIIIKKMKSKKADIIKLATFAKTFTDSIRMLAILAQLTSSKQKAICLCMGKEGRITRTASHLFGNFLMYAPISSTDKTAKGQLLAKQLKKIQNLTPK